MGAPKEKKFYESPAKNVSDYHERSDLDYQESKQSEGVTNQSKLLPGYKRRLLASVQKAPKLLYDAKDLKHHESLLSKDILEMTKIMDESGTSSRNTIGNKLKKGVASLHDSNEPPAFLPKRGSLSTRKFPAEHLDS